MGEWALASYIANLPVDEESLEKVREEMDRDLQAQKLREIPLVDVARGVAAEMGFIAVPQADESPDEISRAGDFESVSDPLTEALGGAPSSEIVGEELNECCTTKTESGISRTGTCSQSQPKNDEVELLRVIQ